LNLILEHKKDLFNYLEPDESFVSDIGIMPNDLKKLIINILEFINNDS
jgi:hypothetical protein